MSDTEFCKFCNENIEEIVGILPLGVKDLTTLRDGIEVLGKKMECDKTRNSCLPLLRVQKQIDKLNKGFK
jgi:hypothetical protein